MCANELNSRFVSILIKEHIGSDVVHRSSAQRAYSGI